MIHKPLICTQGIFHSSGSDRRSKPKKRHMSKQLQALTWFLTWPQAEGITRDNIRDHLVTIGSLKELVVCQEQHEPTEEDKVGGIHFHAYAKYEQRVNWRPGNTKFWEVGGKVAHVEICKNRRACIKYVTKEDKTPIVVGVELEAVAAKKRSYKAMYEMGLADLKDEVHPMNLIRTIAGIQYAKLMEDGARQCEDVRGVWLYGPPGTGKSHVAESLKGEYTLFSKPSSKWWDGYDGQQVVVIEDLDTEHLAHLLKIWADKWACTGEVKGGTVPLRHEVLVVTSNYSITELLTRNLREGQPSDVMLIEALGRRFKAIHLESREGQAEARKAITDKISPSTVSTRSAVILSAPATQEDTQQLRGIPLAPDLSDMWTEIEETPPEPLPKRLPSLNTP